ncbi:MAG: hypothetical protein ACRCW9_06095 [Cetobacterium sp.]
MLMLSVFKIKSIKKNLCGSKIEDVELNLEYSPEEVNEVNKEIVNAFVETYKKIGGMA